VDSQVKGTGNSIIVNAAEYSPGSHVLLVTVNKETVPWTKKLIFTVIVATQVSLNKERLTLPVGETETLNATVSPTNATNKNINWSSDNIAVAMVNNNGFVTAKALGTANITVTTENGGNTAVCVIIVKQFQSITMSFTDQGVGAFSQETFTVSKSGAVNTQIVSLTGTWDSISWKVDNKIMGTGNNLTVNAADYSPGNHVLILTVTRDGIPWTKKLNFIVSN
jgi:uncharacterized protein YjdB